MIGRLGQLLGPRLRQQAGIEKSQMPVERAILVQRKISKWNWKLASLKNQVAEFTSHYSSEQILSPAYTRKIFV